MDVVPRPSASTSTTTGASDESSCDDSTGPTTPDSSPLVYPASLPEDIIRTPLSLFLKDTKPLNYDFPKTGAPAATASAATSAEPIPIRNICVIGAGYVGGPTAAVAALHNPSIRVEVLDKDPIRIHKWMTPHPPIHEPGLDNIVRIVRDGAYTTGRTRQKSDSSSEPRASTRAPNLFFTTDSEDSISKADMILLAVNTPTKTFGMGSGRATNMGIFDSAVSDIAKFAKPGVIIVEKSTVPAGTAQRVRQILSSLRPGLLFEVLSNPEFLSEGCATENLLRPDRVIIGSANTESGRLAAASLVNIYASWVPQSKIVEINVWSSELCKLVANAMLAQRISSINSISAICDKTGANVDDIAKAIGLDTRIGPKFLKAGLGFGGSCFRKDIASLTYLAESLGLEEVAAYWHSVNSMNEYQQQRFPQKVIRRLGETLWGKKIAVLGFAFKPNTGDTRESLAVGVIQTLLQERPTEISIFDPYCKEEDILRELGPIYASTLSDPKGNNSPVKVYNDAYQACSQANAVLIVTACDQFKIRPVQRQNSDAAMNAEPKTPIAKPQQTRVSEGPAILQKNDDETYLSYGLLQQPACPVDCSECRSQSTTKAIVREPLEWARIAYGMKEPKWVFDGRGIIDVPEMEKLGIQVDTLGRQQSVASG